MDVKISDWQIPLLYIQIVTDPVYRWQYANPFLHPEMCW